MPAAARTAKATRTTSGSCRRCAAVPTATPASSRPPCGRTNAGRAAGGSGGARRSAALRPQERLAAVLAGRDVVLACEVLVLRARADLDAGRLREAALQLRVALEAALAELEPWRSRGSVSERVDELRDERHAVGAAANSALQGGLDEATAEDVRRVVGRLEAVLRARTAEGFD